MSKTLGQGVKEKKQNKVKLKNRVIRKEHAPYFYPIISDIGKLKSIRNKTKFKYRKSFIISR